MFMLVSEDRQRKSAVLQIVRKSVPSGRAGVADCTPDVFHMSTARLVVRPTGLDELTAGADDRRYQRLAGTALLGMREPCRAGTCIPARTV